VTGCESRTFSNFITSWTFTNFLNFKLISSNFTPMVWVDAAGWRVHRITANQLPTFSIARRIKGDLSECPSVRPLVAFVIYCLSERPNVSTFINPLNKTMLISGSTQSCRPNALICFLAHQVGLCFAAIALLTISARPIIKVAHTLLRSEGFRSWSRWLAVSLRVRWVINRAVGCHYFPPSPQLPPQPLRGLLPVLLLGEQRHDGCEQFA